MTTESSAISRAIAQAMLWAMVDEPTPPLAPTTAMTRPEAYGLRCREQAANRAHHIDGVHRPDDVVVDAAAHQFAIRRDIVDAADHDDAGSGIAHGREFIEAGQDIAAAFGFQDDHVRSWYRVIGFDGSCHAAHLNREMGLAEAAVFARRSHGGCGFRSLAKGL